MSDSNVVLIVEDNAQNMMMMRDLLQVQGYEVLSNDLQPPLSAGQSYKRVRCGHDDTVNRGRHIIHAGGKYDSHLLVPVIP